MLQLETGIYLGQNKRTFRVPGLVVSETEYTARVFEGWHAHENRHITFIMQGGNREQRKTGELQAQPGTVIFYNNDELHRNLNTAHPSKNINLEIEEAFLQQYDINLNSFSTLQNPTEAKFALLKIYQECRTSDAHSQSTIHALVLQLLHTNMHDPVEALQPAWVTAIREIIYDRWQENLTLQELAKCLQLHPVTISKHFPKYFNCTLGEYQRKVKIEQALAHIKTADKPLTEVAYACGFFDQSHFIRTFKQLTGFLPKAYQKL